MVKDVKMHFEFKNIIMKPPTDSESMYKQACSNDEITVQSWLPQWIANAKHSKERFGSFKEHGIGKLFNSNKNKPCIVAGSGPSLANNIERLAKVRDIPIISCLHNFHYMVDHDVKVDYYVSLDAGPVVIEEISEGGKLSPAEYREATRGKTLLAYVGSHPSLWENWLGDVYLFSCTVPDEEYRTEFAKIEDFNTLVSTGGNVLGACAYIAKAILGSNPLIFVGADFCFSYDRKFHAWDSKYDGQMGQAQRAIDVWGNSVLTWPSYYNFKVWFDWLFVNVPGIYINCSEGGLMGSYPDGNIIQVRQMHLEHCLWMYEMNEELRAQCEHPEKIENKILF